MSTIIRLVFADYASGDDAALSRVRPEQPLSENADLDVRALTAHFKRVFSYRLSPLDDCTAQISYEHSGWARKMAQTKPQSSRAVAVMATCRCLR